VRRKEFKKWCLVLSGSRMNGAPLFHASFWPHKVRRMRSRTSRRSSKTNKRLLFGENLNQTGTHCLKIAIHNDFDKNSKESAPIIS
jgi:hypothetical protein